MKKILEFLWENKDIGIPTTIPKAEYEKRKKLSNSDKCEY